MKEFEYPSNYKFSSPEHHRKAKLKIGDYERDVTVVGHQTQITENPNGIPVPPKGTRLVIFDGENKVIGVHESWLKFSE